MLVFSVPKSFKCIQVPTIKYPKRRKGASVFKVFQYISSILNVQAPLVTKCHSATQMLLVFQVP